MTPRATLAVLLLACALAATLEAAPALLDNPPLFTVRGHVTALRTADFDVDGKLDFAALTWDGWSSEAALYVFRGNGDGTFALPLKTVLPATTDFFDVAPIDGDAVPDVVIVTDNGTYAANLQLLRGNGNGTFGAPGTPVTANRCASGLTLADMTSDGRADVVCGLTVFPSLGNGSFGTPLSGGNFLGGYVVDANGDGKRDVVIREWPGSAIYPGTGTGTFGSPVGIPIEMDERIVVAMANFDGIGWLDYAFIYETLSTGLAGAAGQYGAPVKRGFAQASAMATPDLNGDGRPDLVAAGSHQVSTWITGSDGAPGTRTIYAAAGSASELVTGDFDADGLVDVLAGGQGDAFSNYGVISLLRGAPGGALRGMRAYAVTGQVYGQTGGGSPNGVALSDVTGDGKPDLVTVASAIPAIHVFAGRGDGTFDDAPYATPLLSASWPLPVYADLDDDGMIDVVVSDQYQFRFFLANGDGTYTQSSSFNASAGNPPGYGAGDFNGDGHQDFVHEYAGTLTFHAGRGDGTFDAPVAREYGTSWEGFRIGDVNKDGRDDLVFAGDVLLGAASGIFTVVADGSPFGEPPMALADFDGDGNLDLFSVDQHPQGSVVVKRGNGDGTFGTTRLMEFPQKKTGPRDVLVASPGDFNGDGHTDVALGATILLGDGAGFFNGYMRARDPIGGAECYAGDVDGNASSDLLCAAEGTHSLTVFRTLTAEAQDLPLSIVIESAPAAVPGGGEFDVRVRATGLTSLAPTGAILFSLGGRLAGTVELVDGLGYGRVFAGVVGTQALIARYGGDDVYAAADSAPQQVVVTKGSTYIYEWYAPYEAVTTQPVRITAEVSSSLPDVQGTVSLFIDNVLTGTTAAPELDMTIGPLAEGRRTVRIEYGGSDRHLPTTRTFYITVVKPLIDMAVAVDPPNGTTAGTPVTVTVTFPNEPALNGSVTIYGAQGAFFTVPVANGVATLTTSALPPGQSLTAWFAGNATYRATSKTIAYAITDAPVAPGPTSLYLMPSPCRMLDTREASWPVASGATRAVQISRRCGIPYGAKAVAVNLTVVAPSNYGYFTLFPAASSLPLTSTLNYRPGKTRANNAVLPLSAGGSLNVYNSGPAYVHVLIDVTGYFQ